MPSVSTGAEFSERPLKLADPDPVAAPGQSANRKRRRKLSVAHRQHGTTFSALCDKATDERVGLAAVERENIDLGER